MRRNSSTLGWFKFAVWAAFAGSPFLGSCHSDSPAIREQAGAYGTVTLPLEATTPSGAIYRLVGKFAISGQATLTLSAVNHTGSAISQRLEVGAYTVALHSGWTLLRSESGEFVPTTNAQVVGPSSQSFEITKDAVTPVTFSFEVDGQVVFAEGELQVNFSVQERVPDAGGTGGAGGSGGLNCAPDGSPCSLPNAQGACLGGICFIASCEPAFADCDENQATGCEADLMRDPMNCNSCGFVCSAPHATTLGCDLGQCTVVTCDANFGNCDNMPSNGCESDLSTDPNNCTGCGRSCPTGTLCGSGTCQCPYAHCSTGLCCPEGCHCRAGTCVQGESGEPGPSCQPIAYLP